MKLILTAIFIVLLFACSRLEEAPIQTFDYSKGIINLDSVTQRDWDRVCIILPYTTDEYATEILGVDFSVMENSGIAVDEGITLLVLMLDKKVIHYFETPRNNVDFSSLGAGCIPKGSAKFRVKTIENDWRILERT